MDGTKFTLATYAAYRDSPRARAEPLIATDIIFGLLEGWGHKFPVRQEIVAFISPSS